LHSLYSWIAEAVGPAIALDYAQRLMHSCEKLTNFPQRGTPCDDLAPGLRTAVFERKATVAYTVGTDEVQIVRILHRGQELGSVFDDPPHV
jgi:toxin ParE1/3/4